MESSPEDEILEANANDNWDFRLTINDFSCAAQIIWANTYEQSLVNVVPY